MIETITIKSLEVKSGVSKAGKGYNMVIVETQDGRRMSMYIDKERDLKFKKMEKVADWKAGDVLVVKTEQNGDFLNFDVASKTDILFGRLEDLEKRVVVLEINAKKTK